MAKRPGGLGRGLESLFGDSGASAAVINPVSVSVNPESSEEQSEKAKNTKKTSAKPVSKAAEAVENVVFIKLDNIKPNKAQPRKQFDKEALDELASSIKEHGVIQPVLVRPSGKNYELVAGERRWRAARLAGLKQIPAIIRELDERQNMFYALIENMQREDLNIIEEALGMEEMIKAFDLSQEETAQAVGKSRSYVTNALRLLKLPEKIKDMVMDGTLSAGHARAIAGLKSEELQLEAAEKTAANQWSVRQIEAYTGEQKKTKKRKKPAKVHKFVDIENQISEKIGTKVAIEGSEKRGKLILEYYSRDELERLIEILS